MNRKITRIAYGLPIVALLTAVSINAVELPDQAKDKHMGVASCAASQCHGSAVPQDGTNVLQNEYVTWTQDDPHSSAYAVLSNDLSLLIAERLGLSSARDAKICLDCHADNVTGDRRGERFQISDGVGCEACHGGAENWLATHYDAPEVTHQDNISNGLYPTERAADRAGLCLSCHLGTSDKFATHRIMAAGHPRLAFELDTFTELWRTAGRQPHYRIDSDYAERKAGASHTRTWAEGLLAEGRQRLALVLDEDFAGNSLFPELGLYDCHACHRSLKKVQRQALLRHGRAGPGVPFLNDGVLVMILALTAAVAPDDAESVRAALTALHVAGSASVEDSHAAARNLDDVLRQFQSRLAANMLRNRERRILAEILKSAAAGNFPDYVSAEQAFMAVQMLVIELEDTDLEAELDQLAGTLEDEERYQPTQFAKLLSRLSDQDD